ncbi:hypothetical protein DTO166G4_7166 [Paecilomyces variotii]|nr:hypothetical protein DTO166G4_7166 [Paecilomyces variotii]KAJ9241533.1 hypothetical protein DTO166G5_1154 [Paecilomyces variotii]KAJ9261939.1 hypothetical protein DTO195F2_3927 [Paecilomyces variotii]KAJ9374760.1 hypothetical protein DTO282E5_315 [Paecilomyces variotii]
MSTIRRSWIRREASTTEKSSDIDGGESGAGAVSCSARAVPAANQRRVAAREQPENNSACSSLCDDVPATARSDPTPADVAADRSGIYSCSTEYSVRAIAVQALQEASACLESARRAGNGSHHWISGTNNNCLEPGLPLRSFCASLRLC